LDELYLTGKSDIMTHFIPYISVIIWSWTILWCSNHVENKLGTFCNQDFRFMTTYPQVSGIIENYQFINVATSHYYWSIFQKLIKIDIQNLLQSDQVAPLTLENMISRIKLIVYLIGTKIMKISKNTTFVQVWQILKAVLSPCRVLGW